MKTFNDPASRSRFLRKLHKAPLRERAIQVLGNDWAGVLNALRTAYTRGGAMSPNEFDAHARIILRYTARLENRKDRIKYVRTCIRNEVRKHELTCWLEKHPELSDFLSTEDIRDISKTERRAYDTARAKAAVELDRMNGVRPELDLCKRVGKTEADRMTRLICNKIDTSTADGFRRYVTILRGAAKPTVRHPEKYIQACLRKLRTKSNRD